MSIVTLSTTDSISAVVTDINTVSSNLGDAKALFYGNNCVDAINQIKTITEIYDDSDKIIATTYTSYDAQASEFALASYDDNGNFLFTGANDSDIKALFTVTGNAVTYDNGILSMSDSVEVDQLSDSAITTTKFDQTTVLKIYDENDTVILTLYGPGI